MLIFIVVEYQCHEEESSDKCEEDTEDETFNLAEYDEDIDNNIRPHSVLPLAELVEEEGSPALQDVEE